MNSIQQRCGGVTRVVRSLGLLLSLTGCARVPHLYPVCFYQSAPTQQRVQEVFAPRLLSLLRSMAGDSADAKAAASPDGRWLVASVTDAQNSKIANVWPRVGCIGNALDSPTTRAESDCVRYVEDFVAKHNYFAFGNARDSGHIDIWNESPVSKTLVHCHQLKEDEN